MGRSALSPIGAVAGSRSKPATFVGALGLKAGVWGGSRAVLTAMQLVPPWQDPSAAR